MSDLYSFADNADGLTHAWNTSVSLRQAGFKTRLATRQVSDTVVQTVVTTPPARPPRKVRLRGFLNTR